MANEAVSKYHYPSLVVGNLVTIPKSGDLKFYICPPFRQTLLSSDDFIDHTIPDTYWGTGIDKRDPMESGLQELVYVFHAWKQHPHELYTPHEKVA
jgi:hypothetical protein